MNNKIMALCMLLITGSALSLPRSTVIHEIENAEEYRKIKKSLRKPTIFIFNSATCQACKMMAQGLADAAKKYPQVNFYSIADLKSDAFKGLPKELKIKGYPTTHLCKPGVEPCIERGSIDADELDQIIYKFVHGKPRPAPAQPQGKKPAEAAAESQAKK